MNDRYKLNEFAEEKQGYLKQKLTNKGNLVFPRTQTTLEDQQKPITNNVRVKKLLKPSFQATAFIPGASVAHEFFGAKQNKTGSSEASKMSQSVQLPSNKPSEPAKASEGSSTESPTSGKVSLKSKLAAANKSKMSQSVQLPSNKPSEPAKASEESSTESSAASKGSLKSRLAAAKLKLNSESFIPENANTGVFKPAEFVPTDKVDFPFTTTTTGTVPKNEEKIKLAEEKRHVVEESNKEHEESQGSLQKKIALQPTQTHHQRKYENFHPNKPLETIHEKHENKLDQAKETETKKKEVAAPKVEKKEPAKEEVKAQETVTKIEPEPKATEDEFKVVARKDNKAAVQAEEKNQPKLKNEAKKVSLENKLAAANKLKLNSENIKDENLFMPDEFIPTGKVDFFTSNTTGYYYQPDEKSQPADEKRSEDKESKKPHEEKPKPQQPPREMITLKNYEKMDNNMHYIIREGYQQRRLDNFHPSKPLEIINENYEKKLDQAKEDTENKKNVKSKEFVPLKMKSLFC